VVRLIGVSTEEGDRGPHGRSQSPPPAGDGGDPVAGETEAKAEERSAEEGTKDELPGDDLPEDDLPEDDLPEDDGAADPLDLDEPLVASEVDFVWESPRGETRLEAVHLPLFGGIIRTVRVHRGVNLDTHPELEAAVRDGTLHELDSGESLAVPYLLHLPHRRRLALVVPEALRHEALRVRARFFADLASDALDPVPPYVLEAQVVVGQAELAELLDAPERPRALDPEAAELLIRAGRLAQEEGRVGAWEAELEARERELELREAELEVREEELAAGEEDLLLRARELDDRVEQARRAGWLPVGPEELDPVDGEGERRQPEDPAGTPKKGAAEAALRQEDERGLEEEAEADGSRSAGDASGAHPLPRRDTPQEPTLDDVELVDEEAEAVVAELDEVVRDSVRAGASARPEQPPASSSSASASASATSSPAAEGASPEHAVDAPTTEPDDGGTATEVASSSEDAGSGTPPEVSADPYQAPDAAGESSGAKGDAARGLDDPEQGKT
jgi:hypothetical protein